MSLSFSSSGFDEASKLLKELPKAMEEKVYEHAVRQGANLVARAVRLNAPKDEGTLKKSIRVKKLTAKSEKLFGEKQVSYGVYIKQKAYYGRMLEYGTSKMTAKPWFRPAVDGVSSTASQRVKVEMINGLKTQTNALASRFGTLKPAKIKAFKVKRV